MTVIVLLPVLFTEQKKKKKSGAKHGRPLPHPQDSSLPDQWCSSLNMLLVPCCETRQLPGYGLFVLSCCVVFVGKLLFAPAPTSPTPRRLASYARTVTWAALEKRFPLPPPEAIPAHPVTDPIPRATPPFYFS